MKTLWTRDLLLKTANVVTRSMVSGSGISAIPGSGQSRVEGVLGLMGARSGIGPRNPAQRGPENVAPRAAAAQKIRALRGMGENQLAATRGNVPEAVKGTVRSFNQMHPPVQSPQRAAVAPAVTPLPHTTTMGLPSIPGPTNVGFKGPAKGPAKAACWATEYMKA